MSRSQERRRQAFVVTGSTCIGGVKGGCLGERTISICNVGDCKLNVTDVALKRNSKYWKLINNPFPATLHPGSCLNVLIRYKAAEKCPRPSELIIVSDDPDSPEKLLTSWPIPVGHPRSARHAVTRAAMSHGASATIAHAVCKVSTPVAMTKVSIWTDNFNPVLGRAWYWH